MTCPICKETLYVRDRDTPDQVVYCKKCKATWSDHKEVGA